MMLDCPDAYIVGLGQSAGSPRVRNSKATQAVTSGGVHLPLLQSPGEPEAQDAEARPRGDAHRCPIPPESTSGRSTDDNHHIQGVGYAPSPAPARLVPASYSVVQ